MSGDEKVSCGVVKQTCKEALRPADPSQDWVWERVLPFGLWRRPEFWLTADYSLMKDPEPCDSAGGSGDLSVLLL